MIIGGVATIPPREQSLRRMLTSILSQVDELHVYLSQYVGYLRNLPDKVIQHKPLNDIDLCDAGKFVGLDRAHEEKAYFISLDDDLFYPPNYVDRLCGDLLTQQGRSVSTFHGRSFVQFPINSYYKSATRRVYCLRRHRKDEEVHVGGTGCMGFWPFEIGVKLSDFPTPNMADVHMGVYCKNNDIPIVCLSHEEKWIRQLPIDHSQSIYRKHVNSDAEQTRRINEAFG